MEYLTLKDKILEIVSKAVAIICTIVTIVLSFVVMSSDEYETPLFNENYLPVLYVVCIVLTLIAAYIETNNKNKYDA